MFSLCLIYDNAVKNPTRIYASTLSWLSRLCTIPSCPQTINSIKKPVIRHNELKETYFVIINAIKKVQKPNAKNFQSKNASAKINPDTVDIYFESKAGKLKIVENGMATDYSEAKATKILSENEVTAIADVKMGDCKATAWGCDLTHEYVSINADYRS